MTFASVAVAALALAAPAAARPRSSRTYPTPPPPEHTVPSGNVNEHETSSSTSTANCTAEVKASTESTAKSAFVDLVAAMSRDLCFASETFGDISTQGTKTDYQQHDGKISAVAELLLESKLQCATDGKYALACAQSWAGAYSFAGAGVELYASAWADGSISNCECAVDIFANADALTSSWADIWTEIYATLDDHVCAQSYDGTADSVKSEVNVHCVGNLILRFWVKAIAKVISTGQCYPKDYLVCDKCCKDAYGGYKEGCNVEECQTSCREYESGLVKATATAIIEFAEPEVIDAYCGVDKTIDAETYWYHYVPGTNGFKAHFNANGYEDTIATCEATAYASSFASSASAQAKNILGIWESTCNPYSWASTGAGDFDKTVTDWAKAYVQVFAKAFTECSLEGGDPYYDGGCARAVSYSQAYAEACAEAISKATIEYSYGKGSCECDIGVSVLKTAIAHEIETIAAFYEVGVEARSCNPDNHGSPDFAYITQFCRASSMADMVAKSMASVSLEGGCLPTAADKKEYCETQACKEYPTYDPQWTPCLEECTKNSDVSVTSALEAVATLTVNTEKYCSDNLYGPRSGETYLLKLNGEANSTQTP